MDIIALTKEFHKIQSNNHQESHKNFQLFLLTLPEKLSTKENENKFISDLIPQSKLEHLFKIDILLHLKRHDDVLDVLKSGNNRYIGRILKDFPFFAEIITKLDVKTVINDIFPQISYVTKLKILNRISNIKIINNEELLDRYFEEVKTKYGLDMAFILIAGCSKKLIRFKVEKYVPNLPSRHVTEIYKKDNSFPLFYFDLMKNIDEDFNVFKDYSMLIKLIARKDPTLFWELQQKFKFDFKIGKHLTKKLILSNENVLKDGVNCVKWFQNKELYKTIKEKDGIDDFLLTFCGDTPIEFLEQIFYIHSWFFRILKFISRETRYELIKNLFNRKYSQNILKYETIFPFHFLEIIPIPIRELIIKTNYNAMDDYLYLLNPNEAFIEIKKLLKSCFKVQERKNKLELLSKVVVINLKNEKIVTEILKFVLERYRNDVQPFKVFVYNIVDNEKNLRSFTENQLILLNQMAPYTLTDFSNRLGAENISRAYLKFLMKNNKSYDEYLMDYLKRIALDDNYYNCIFMTELENINLIIGKILGMIDNFKDNKSAYNRLTMGAIKHIFSYNEKHKKNLIPLSLYKEILKHVFINGNAYDKGTYFKYLIKRYNDKDIHQCFWEHYETTNQWKSLIWFFKNDIKQIEDHLNLILSSNHQFFIAIDIYKAFHDYSNDFIKEKSLEFIKNNLSYDNLQKTCFLLPILCTITDTKTFLEITSNFMPPLNGKFEIENAQNKKFIHENVIKCLRDIQFDENDKLKIIKKVCIGDFLKFGIKVLYKNVLNMKEVDVLNFLNDYKSNQPVSVSKHAILLSLSLQVHESELFLKKTLENEKNSSIKNLIFKKFLDIFFNTKNETTYKQLKGYFKIINTEDTHLLEIMIKKMKNVPILYKVDYVLSLFELIKRSKKEKKIPLLTVFSKNIPKNILNDIPINILKNIIKIILEELFLRKLSEDFFWDFIMNTNQENGKELFLFTTEIMKETIASFNSEKGYLQIRIPLNYFTMTFCKKLLINKDVNHLGLIEIIDMQWDFFPKHCLLNTKIFIKMTKHFFESKFDLKKFAFLLNNLLQQFIKEYDSSIISELSQQIVELFKIIDEDNKDLCKFTNFLIHTDNNNNYNYILAIYLLPKAFPTDNNKYYKWVETLQSIEEFCIKGKNAGSVCFHFDKYLREHHNKFVWVGNQKFPDVATTKL